MGNLDGAMIIVLIVLLVCFTALVLIAIQWITTNSHRIDVNTQKLTVNDKTDKRQDGNLRYLNGSVIDHSAK